MIRLLILFTMILPFFVVQRPWQPASDTCPTFGHCGNATGGQVTVYWRGMNQVQSLRIKVDGGGAIGGCPQGLTQFEVFPPRVAQGSAPFTGISPGYYIVRVDAVGPQGQVYHGEHPVKMDCEFRRGAGLPGRP